MSTSSIILQAYLHTSKEMARTFRYEDINESFLKEAKWGALTPLNYYLDTLKQTDELLFAYMDDERTEKVLRDLQITQLLLSTQKEYEKRRQKTENAAVYDEHRQRCANLINLLQTKKYCERHNFPLPPDFGQQTDGRPVAYLGISFGQWLAQQVASWMNSKTKTVIGSMNAFNEKRLYWVWGSALLKTMIELMPEDLVNLDNARDTARALDPLTGTLSWSLYYCRFFFHLGLLLKHTIAGPWMEEEERNMPWQERFQTQWAQRKFALLNDSLWGTVNLLYFFWLNGKGVLGAAGDLLTIVVLVFDLTAAVWDYDEQKTNYNKEMFDYETQLEQLEAERVDLKSPAQIAKEIADYQQQIKNLEQHKLKASKKEASEDEQQINELQRLLSYLTFKQQIPQKIVELQKEITKLTAQLEQEWEDSPKERDRTQFLNSRIKPREKLSNLQSELELLTKRNTQALDDEEYLQKMKDYATRIAALEQARARCKRDWHYQNLNLINSISYAVGLLIAYALLTTPFLPIGGATLVAVGLAGAIMCFAFTVINNGIRGGIELYKEHSNTKEAIADYKNKLAQLGKLFMENADPNSNDKKLLYIEILQAAATTNYQHQLVELKTAHLVRSVFIHSVIPALILVNLVFLPLGVGLGVIGALIALAIISNFVVDKLFKAEKKSLEAFDEVEYIKFCNKEFNLELPSPEVSKVLSRGSQKQSFFNNPLPEVIIDTTEYSYSPSYDSGDEADDEEGEEFFNPRPRPSEG